MNEQQNISMDRLSRKAKVTPQAVSAFFRKDSGSKTILRAASALFKFDVSEINSRGFLF